MSQPHAENVYLPKIAVLDRVVEGRADEDPAPDEGGPGRG